LPEGIRLWRNKLVARTTVLVVRGFSRPRSVRLEFCCRPIGPEEEAFFQSLFISCWRIS